MKFLGLIFSYFVPGDDFLVPRFDPGDHFLVPRFVPGDRFLVPRFVPDDHFLVPTSTRNFQNKIIGGVLFTKNIF